MASSDAGTPWGSEYQVFLNFRGSDTLSGFTDFLYTSLIDTGIGVFRDDEELRIGERIDQKLVRAIDECRIYVPVFSPTYAWSQWCLRELSQMVTNTLKSEGNKEILPIFYNVEPNDVKLKTPLYRDALLNLECEKELNNEEVNAWREALTEIDPIKRWEVKKDTSEGELIKLVVETVIQKLKTKQKLVIQRFIGIDEQLQEISKLLDINSSGVRLIIIHGMRGIGKTTLAKFVFSQFSSHFGKGCCFVKDVRARLSRTDGLDELQKELFAKIGHSAGTGNTDEMNYGVKRTGEALCNEKVLIVLDDVDKMEQVEKLIGKSTLCSGSRILITARYISLLPTNTSNYEVLSYEMMTMRYNHALELFSWHAFNKNSPSPDYDDLSKGIIYKTGMFPLVLEVIGSFLYREGQQQWLETLYRLDCAPPEDVMMKLKISYDALTFEQREIFLDIACFLIGEDKTNAIYMWRDCELFPDYAIDVLVRMSLVKIAENNKFWMQDLLRDFGREMVRRETPMGPRARSRIWTCREVLNEISSKEMDWNVQGLYLDSYGQSSDDKVVLRKEIGTFKHLRFLKLLGGTFAGDLANFLPNLRWISWYFLPPSHEWTNMYLKNVVVLEFAGIDLLDDSRLQGLIKRAGKLKVLSLKSCPKIKETPDFFGCLNLERLTFEDCSNLRRIDSSIGKLEYLIDLKIDGCFCLQELPEEIEDLVNLMYFFVQRCKVKKLPDSIWKLKSLRELYFSNHFVGSALPYTWELPSAIGRLPNLEVLLVNSFNLKGQLPSGIGHLPFLRILNLSYTCVSEVPETISMLRHLQKLELMACNDIQELPMLPTSLTHLRVSSASLRAIPNLSYLSNLVELDLIIVEKDEIN